MKDLHNVITARRVVSPIAGATGGKTGVVIDRAGYGGVEFIVSYGAVSSSVAAFTVTMKEGDVSGTLTSVADADMLGTEALAGLAAGARVSGSTMNVTKRVGYKGDKRYVNLSVVSTTTNGVPVSISAILHSPITAPTANP